MSVISEFTDTARFTIRRRLGSGGMGVVYLAHDRERGVDVALKTLVRVDARGIAGLKNEFRALAGVTHPNLVVLHELFSEGGQWFFTMEVVDGVTFLEHVNAARASAPGRGLATAVATVTATPPREIARTTVISSPNGAAAPAALTSPAPLLPRAASTCDFAGLRPALGQLAEAVYALHGAGKLHRDLKPSNVMVTPEARVVILDFGLAVIHGERRVEPSAAARLIEGTPAYMAPEQTIGEPARPASDWYAVGAMLYEALTGRLPFTGDVRRMLGQKRVVEPISPSLVVSGPIPEDLDRLCVELLRIAPDQRPTGLEVLLPAGRRRERAQRPGGVRGRALRGAGRRAGRALAGVRGHARGARGDGAPAGPVGPGQVGAGRALPRRGVAGRRARWSSPGRCCYERKAMPYKAWDSLVDALVRHLCRLDYDETLAIVPPNVHDLARVFPVLREVEIVDEQIEERPPPSDALESRRRAFDALRDLLHNLAKRRPLVLHLDDLQWGDVDSAKLMATVLSPPDPPRILLLCSYRSEEAEGSEFFRELGSAETAARGLGQVETLDLDRLPAPESTALARALLGDHPAAAALASAIAREADGSPFFVTELVRSVHEEGPTSGTAPRAFSGVSLEGVLRSRIGRLPADARRILEIMAVAARPIEQGTCARAAGVLSPDPALSALRAANLIRSRGLRPRDLAEPYHDRVRELVVKGLDPAALREAHLFLATELEEEGADAEVLAAHYEGAGERARAAGYALRAAENATGTLRLRPRGQALWPGALARGGGHRRRAAHPADRARRRPSSTRATAPRPLPCCSRRRSAWAARARARPSICAGARPSSSSSAATSTAGSACSARCWPRWA